MATIEERKYKDKETGKVTVRYRAKIRLKGFAPEECTFPTKTLAKEWAAKREYELKHDGLFGPQHHKNKTVGDMLERYETSLKLANPKRQKGIAPFIKFWKERVGHYKLNALTADVAIMHRDALQKRHVKDDPDRGRVTNASVNRVFGVLKCALNVAIKEWKWLAHNPLSGVKNLKEPPGRTRFLNSEELDRLLTACDQSENTDLHSIISLAITTGARRGEIMRIRLTDVDLDTRRIVLWETGTKNKTARILHLVEPTLSMVKSLLEKAPPKQQYLFTSPLDYSRPNDFRRSWNTAVRRSKLDNFHFHDLRHTAASYFARHGAKLHHIAELLGHKSLHMAKRYTHLLETDTVAIAENTATKVFGNGKAGLAQPEGLRIHEEAGHEGLGVGVHSA